jgi:hypothetical protein
MGGVNKRLETKACSGNAIQQEEKEMGFSEQEYVDLGARFATQRMIEQAKVSVAVARAHSADLKTTFPEPKIVEAERLVSKIEGLYDEQAEKKFERNTAGAPVAAQVKSGKAWVISAMAIADNAFEEEHAIRDQFHQSGKIGSSVPKLTGRMASLLALAEKNREAMAGWGLTPELFDQGKTILASLSQSNTVQEKALKDLPPKTRELYAAKGRLYILLKQLSRAGRIAFAGDPTSVAKLNLDILNRKGSRKSEKPAPQA